MSGKTKQKNRFSNSVRIENRKARFDYEILEKFEAGLSLSGNEVKSLREGKASLVDVYALTRGDELYLRGMHINPYEEGNVEGNPTRERKLLLKRREINRLIGQTAQKGLTLIPLKVYFNEKGWAKVQLGLCRGKKDHDKRDVIRQRDLDRDMRRTLKER